MSFILKKIVPIILKYISSFYLLKKGWELTENKKQDLIIIV